MKGITIVDGSAGTGCVSFLKKKLWLRLFHAAMLQDVSEFLLDPFGKPVTFNRTKSGDMFMGSLDDCIKNGYKCSIGFDSLRIRIECKVSLDHLIMMPWFLNGKTKVKITKGAQYRLGYEKSDSTMKEALSMIRVASFDGGNHVQIDRG